MKKFLAAACSITMLSNVAFAADYSMQIQVVEAEVTRLMSEKQRQYDELEKCANGVSGFKIAGISLLGLTAVGVGVNVHQAVQYNRIDRAITQAEKDAETAKTEIAKIELEKQRAEALNENNTSAQK